MLVSQGNWIEELKNYMEKYKFDCILDCLGGGPVTDALISNLVSAKSTYIFYGDMDP